MLNTREAYISNPFIPPKELPKTSLIHPLVTQPQARSTI